MLTPSALAIAVGSSELRLIISRTVLNFIETLLAICWSICSSRENARSWRSSAQPHRVGATSCFRRSVCSGGFWHRGVRGLMATTQDEQYASSAHHAGSALETSSESFPPRRIGGAWWWLHNAPPDSAETWTSLRTFLRMCSRGCALRRSR